jgi:uncharacterized lipoprotein YmbA
MKKLLAVFTISALLLTGCATPENKPEYDALELATYNLCVEKVVDGWVKSSTFLLTAQYIEQAKNECSELLPVKK